MSLSCGKDSLPEKIDPWLTNERGQEIKTNIVISYQLVAQKHNFFYCKHIMGRRYLMLFMHCCTAWENNVSN